MNSPHEKTEYAIEVQNLSMRFGQDTVVKNVSCKLQAGQIHGLIGRNGSGKTVLMKCILGFLRPSSGEAKVFGKRIGQDVDFAPDTGMLIESPLRRMKAHQQPVAGDWAIRPKYGHPQPLKRWVWTPT